MKNSVLTTLLKVFSPKVLTCLTQSLEFILQSLFSGNFVQLGFGTQKCSDILADNILREVMKKDFDKRLQIAIMAFENDPLDT